MSTNVRLHFARDDRALDHRAPTRVEQLTSLGVNEGLGFNSTQHFVLFLPLFLCDQ